MAIVFLLVMLFVDGAHAKTNDSSVCPQLYDQNVEPIDALEQRLNVLTYRLELLAFGVDNRLEEEVVKESRTLKMRLSAIEESDAHRVKICSEGQFQCGDTTKCISHLFVCDRIQDCSNGEDENECDLPFGIKAEFEGTEIFDNCGQRHPGNFTLVIKSIRASHIFPGFRELGMVIVIRYADRSIRIGVAIPVRGYYRFSDRTLVVFSPGPALDRIGMNCKFISGDFNTCIGTVIKESSDAVCAQFYFTRKH